MTKKFTLIMLPSKRSKLYREEDGSLHVDEVLTSYGGVDHFHLYAILQEPTPAPLKYPHVVAEKLTTGEWSLWQVDNINDIDTQNQRTIVATTENALHQRDDKNYFAKLPESFFDTYTKAFNSKKPITEISLETDDTGKPVTDHNNFVKIAN